MSNNKAEATHHPEMPDVQLAMIDGRDALLLALVKPGSGDGFVTIDAHCNGLDKMQARQILLHVARQWKADAEASTTAHRDGSN